MSNLRDKYRATDAKVLKKKVTEEDAEFNTGRGQFLQLTDGKNRIRFFPPHDSKSNFYVLRGYYWIQNYSDDDSGDETYKRTVLNAKFHYPGAKLDLIDEYAAAARSFIEANDTLEPAEKAAKLEVFTNWKTGLQMSRSWIAYALKIAGDKREFGLFEMNKTLRDKINAEVMLEDDDDPIETDPFTDPNEGKVVIVFRNKAEQKADKRYGIKVGKADELTDEELELFDRSKPLSEVFIYSAKDWDAGLEGIKIFDDTHDIGLFEDQDWLDRIEEIKAQFRFAGGGKANATASSSKKKAADDDDDDDAPPPKKAAPAKPAAKPVPTAKKPPVVEEDDDEEETPLPPADEPETDEFDAMDRDELKAWIANKHEESERAAEVLRVKKSMEDEDIRVMIRKFLEEEGQQEETAADDDEEETPPPAKKAAAPPPATGAKKTTNLADVRAKLAGLKKA